MKEKGRSRALHKKPYGLCKRFLAAMIAAVMVTTNIGTDLTTAYAAESSDSVTFEMSGSGLVTAIEEAIAAGSPLQEGDIDFTNGKTEQFEALFYGEGNIYEIYPEYDGLYRHTTEETWTRSCVYLSGFRRMRMTCIWSPEMRKLYSCM